MKIQHIFIALVLFGTYMIPALAADIHWYDVGSGMESGKKQNKYIFADVYTDECVFCKLLDQNTFTDPQFIDFLGEKFVCIKANALDKGAGQKLAKEYGVDVFPCILIFDRSGKLIGRVVGYKEAPEFQEILKEIIADHK